MNQRTTPILFALGLLITVPSFAQVAYVYCDEFYSDSFEYQELGVGITWQSIAGKNYSIITNASLTAPPPRVSASEITGLETETSHTTTVSGAGTLFYEIGVE